MNRFLTVFFVTAFICLAATSGDAVEQRPFQLADIHALKDISDPQISPDGSRIICAVSETSAVSQYGACSFRWQNHRKKANPR